MIIAIYTGNSDHEYYAHELKCAGFEANIIRVEVDMTGGTRYVFKFENGYGASVIKTIGSYGFAQDLWELAVIKFDDNDVWDITYDTIIADDVVGWLTDEKVVELLVKIKELGKIEEL